MMSGWVNHIDTIKGMRRTTSFSALSVRRVVSAPSPAATRLLTGVEC